MQEEGMDFGILGQSVSGDYPIEPGAEKVGETATPSHHKPGRKLGHTTKAKSLAPLLNALELEIEEIMGLLDLVMGIDRRTDILCRKVSNSLMRIQDIRDKIAAEMMGGMSV